MLASDGDPHIAWSAGSQVFAALLLAQDWAVFAATGAPASLVQVPGRSLASLSLSSQYAGTHSHPGRASHAAIPSERVVAQTTVSTQEYIHLCPALVHADLFEMLITRACWASLLAHQPHAQKSIVLPTII